MFDLDGLFRGFSNQDEYIARDMMILELLIVQDQKKAYTRKRLDEHAEQEKKDDTI